MSACLQIPPPPCSASQEMHAPHPALETSYSLLGARMSALVRDTLRSAKGAREGVGMQVWEEGWGDGTAPVTDWTKALKPTFILDVEGKDN